MILSNFNQIKCPKCSGLNFWKTADARLKCKNCRYLFTPYSNPFKISDQVLRSIVSEFLLEHSTNLILERINISKYKLLKILNFLRKLIWEDLPPLFKGKVKPQPILSPPPTKDPIIGIYSQEGMIYATILSDISPEEIKSFLKNKNYLIPPSEKWLKSFAIIFKGRIYRLSPKTKKQIDAIETFWGYLKRKFSERGGIRKEKLPLYLGEYLWRYNNRKLSFKEREEKLLNLITAHFRGKI